ncbi:MAG: hypothetical protein ABIF09_12035 [Gemmatimonadota bacterium]
MRLSTFHVGWENEHLARFLLSRLAFVASPVFVGDDVGTDLFCTLFERRERNGKVVLAPLNSIAIQIKSSKGSIDVTSKLEYFDRLEIPYYLGFVNRETVTLDLYSARYLPAMLSYRARPKRLELVPTERFIRDYRPGTDEDGYKLLCHKVITLGAPDDENATAAALEALTTDAAHGLSAIASRLNKEYVFDFPDGTMEFMPGPGSKETFRESFFTRLAEALSNLSWLIETGQEPSIGEVDAYLAAVDVLGAASSLPAYVEAWRSRLRERRQELIAAR